MICMLFSMVCIRKLYLGRKFKHRQQRTRIVFRFLCFKRNKNGHGQHLQHLFLLYFKFKTVGSEAIKVAKLASMHWTPRCCLLPTCDGR